MRNGSVPSTRVISASARRRSAAGGVAWRGLDAVAGSSCERSCRTGLVMDMGSHERRHDGRDEEPAAAGLLLAKGGQPILKTDGAKPRIVAGRKRPVVQLRSEIAWRSARTLR